MHGSVLQWLHLFYVRNKFVIESHVTRLQKCREIYQLLRLLKQYRSFSSSQIIYLMWFPHADAQETICCALGRRRPTSPVSLCIADVFGEHAARWSQACSLWKVLTSFWIKVWRWWMLRLQTTSARYASVLVICATCLRLAGAQDTDFCSPWRRWPTPPVSPLDCAGAHSGNDAAMVVGSLRRRPCQRRCHGALQDLYRVIYHQLTIGSDRKTTIVLALLPDWKLIWWGVTELGLTRRRRVYVHIGTEGVLD